MNLKIDNVVSKIEKVVKDESIFEKTTEDINVIVEQKNVKLMAK